MKMKCKFCSAELEENVVVCPACGKDQQEETAQSGKKKFKTWQLVAAIAGGLVLLAVLVGAILYSMGINIIPRANDLYYKDSYTVKDEVAIKNADVVVATMQDQELTSGELQIYYWSSVLDYIDYYHSSVLMGMELDLPLDEQIYDEETGMTFQQMFLEAAIETWRRYATLKQMAENDGFALTEEQLAELEAFQSQVEAYAAADGYDDLDAYFAEMLAPGSTMKTYDKYNRMNYIGLSYYNEIYDTVMPTYEEIEVFYEKNEEGFITEGIGKDAGNLYDVRHILIEPEGGTVGDDGYLVFSEEEWETCRVKAQEILDTYLAGEKTEEAFGALAKEHTADYGSRDYGGLYEQLDKNTNFVPEFKEWYLDESRKVGDTGLVKSDYGYHVMYLSASRPIWEIQAEIMLASSNTEAMLKEAQEQWPMEVDFSKIVLGFVELS